MLRSKIESPPSSYLHRDDCFMYTNVEEDCPNPSAHPKASSQALGCDIPDDLSHTWAQRKFPLLVPTLFSECFCSYQPHDPSFMSFPIPSHYKVMAFSMVPQMPKDLFHFLNQNIILTTSSRRRPSADKSC